MTWIPTCLALASLSLFVPTDTPPLRYNANEAFGVGERLTYDVGYKFISAGTAVFDVAKDLSYVNGRPCYKITFVTASHPSLDFIYKVRDTYRTYLDVDGIFPWKFEQHIRERNYSKDYTAEFDQTEHKAKTTEGTADIPAFVHDVVSAFYYVRTLDLKSMKRGQSIKLQNFVDGKVHDLNVYILGKQRIEVDAGIYDCIVVEPRVAQGSPFGFEGRLTLWLSDDERKIPVKVSTQIPIGSIDAELKKYQGTRGPINAKVN
ncbi:MAG: DUF3108 domain-containing protein [Bradyrhizobiaceae bacterium]|nr:DUF3108 domain-containing protein [Bradyrhizobiaceae bacterium]